MFRLYRPLIQPRVNQRSFSQKIVFPKDRNYSRSHEWVKVEREAVATVGVTDYCQDEMGSINRFEVPDATKKFKKGQVYGKIEASKASVDLRLPVAGKLLKANPDLLSNPGIINIDPYERGWMVQVEMSNPADINNLLTPEKYEAWVTAEKERKEKKEKKAIEDKRKKEEREKKAIEAKAAREQKEIEAKAAREEKAIAAKAIRDKKAIEAKAEREKKAIVAKAAREQKAKEANEGKKEKTLKAKVASE